MSEPLERATYTVWEAAQVLGISLGQAYRVVREGGIPLIRIGGRILIPREALYRQLLGIPSLEPKGQEHD